MFDDFMDAARVTLHPIYVIVVILVGYCMGWFMSSHRSLRDPLILVSVFTLMGIVWYTASSNGPLLAAALARYTLFVIYIASVGLGVALRFRGRQC